MRVAGLDIETPLLAYSNVFVKQEMEGNPLVHVNAMQLGSDSFWWQRPRSLEGS